MHGRVNNEREKIMKKFLIFLLVAIFGIFCHAFCYTCGKSGAKSETENGVWREILCQNQEVKPEQKT